MSVKVHPTESAFHKRDCTHLQFVVSAEVTSLTATKGGPTIGFTCDLRVVCEGCGEPFVWKGLRAGIHPDEPTLSIDGQELRALIAPASGRLSPLDVVSQKQSIGEA